jgi:glycosyltransferase involved in cell wall biosynthesis
MGDMKDNTTITNPAVSVIMPCYNASTTVDEAIETLVKQTLREIEIIAIDDGSTDTTLESLRAWRVRDRRIRILERPHEGIIPALNAGLASCKAPLIARMDADDLTHPERLSRQVVFLKEHAEIALVGCLVEGYPPRKLREGFRTYINWLNGLITPESIAREIYVESPLAHPSIMMRRSWLDQVGVYEEHGWPEDYDLWLRLHLAGAKLAKVPEVLLSWREHPGRLTRTDSRYSIENFLRAKAYYLCQSLIRERDALFVWGAGRTGRSFSKHLLAEGASITAFLDIDPKKIGRRLHDRPVLPAEDLPLWWKRYERPILLAAVGAKGARSIIRGHLTSRGFQETVDWWAVS